MYGWSFAVLVPQGSSLDLDLLQPLFELLIQ